MLIGGRMSEMPSQSYTLFGIPIPGSSFVHVHPEAEELGRVYQPTLAIHASPTAFAASWKALQPPQRIAWAQQTAEARADYLAWNEASPAIPGACRWRECMVFLRARLPADAIVTNGAGNYADLAGSLSRYPLASAHSLRRAPARWAMACRPRSAQSACIRDRMVVCFAGDGCFLMNGQEFATAVQYDLPVIVIVVDNGMYGTIRMHQERELSRPRFGDDAEESGFLPPMPGLSAAMARRVETTAEFAPAFERAVAQASRRSCIASSIPRRSRRERR